MRLLLDTHALLWWLANHRTLGPQARALIEDHANDVLVSTVSRWEVAIKARAGRLRADVGEIVAALPRESFKTVTIATAHLMTLMDMPLHHRDPFDHLLIVQAIAEDATFVSCDSYVPLYPVRHMPCSE